MTKRTVYFFDCRKCKKRRRQSVDKAKASNEICRVCLNPHISKGQIDFEGNVYE